MTDRKFYKRVLRVEVISEDAIPDMELDDYHEQITDGDMSGKVEVIEDVQLDGLQAAQLLESQGSDPSFFRLDADGSDTDEL